MHITSICNSCQILRSLGWGYLQKAELKLESMYFYCHEKARGTDMPSSPEQLIPEADKASATSTWLRRFMMIGLTILIWVALVGIFFWFLGVIATPVLLLFLATVLAYVLYPLVKLLSRYVRPCHASSLLPRCSFPF